MIARERLPKKAKATKKIVKRPVWGRVHAKEMRRLYNHYVKDHPRAELNNYIEKNKRTLSGYVNSLELSNSSAKGIFFMIARYLEVNFPNDRYITIYQELGYQAGLRIQAHENEGEQSERELMYYRPLEFYENVLEIQKEEFEDTNEYLLLAAITYQPSLRAEFYVNCKIISQKANDDKESNYLFIKNKKTNVYRKQ